MSNNGRKIYNSERERRRKQRQLRGFLSFVFSITIVFGIGVIGFNLAKPVIKYFSGDDESSSAQVNADAQPSDTYELILTEPPVTEQITDNSEQTSQTTTITTDETDVSENTDNSDNSDITETLENSENTDNTDNIKNSEVSSSPQTTSVTSETKKPVSTTKPVEPIVTTTVSESYSSLKEENIQPSVTTSSSQKKYSSSYHLTIEDMESMSNFNSSLSKAVHQEGCTSVIVPLKQTGGYIYYASSVEGANGSGAVKSNLQLSEIVSAIKSKGLTPIAEVSTLYDNVYSQVYTIASYKFADDGTTSWWDNSQEKGGKPWLSPYSEYSKQYLASLASEISNAGFTKIICTDFVFPPFRDSDVELLGSHVVSKDRYKELLSVAYAMDDAVNENTDLSVSFSAYDAIKGNAEVLAPSEMNGLSVTPVIDMTNFGNYITTYKGQKFDLSGSTFNKAVGIIEALESVCDGVEMTPCFKSENLDSDDLQQIMKATNALGYDCYFN